jgi:flagellar biosynthetic protein FliR
VNGAAPESLVLGAAAVFARIGGVFLIAPGISSIRVPVRVRLFIALALALALVPLVIEDAAAAVEGAAPATILRMLGTETVIGLLLGLLARLLLMALETMAVGIANMIGLGGIPSIAVDGPEPTPAAATFFTMTAVTLIFLADLHYEILRALLGSYAVVPPGAGLDPRAALVAVADQIAAAFLVAVRLAAPFFIYAVILNFAIGIVNKLTPQIPAFFVALPFMIAGGLFLMVLSIREMMIAFTDAFAQLAGGL